MLSGVCLIRCHSPTLGVLWRDDRKFQCTEFSLMADGCADMWWEPLDQVSTLPM